MSCDLTTLAQPCVREMMPYQPGKPVSELQRELGLTSIVKLASNENPLGPSPVVREAFEQEFAELARYPDGSGFALKQKLAARLSVEPAQITLGNGSNDVLELIARVFAGPGLEVIYSQYAFIVYALATQAVGATAKVVPAREWGHDLDAMLAAITPQTRLIYIANPNNPTGTAVDPASLARFLDQVPPQVLVVLDEAYHEYLPTAEQAPSITWLAHYPNLIVSRTFSKAWGLAGLRIGYAVSHPQVADLLNRLRQPFNNNSVALRAAERVLDDEDHLGRSVAVNSQGREQLYRGFESLGLAFIPSRGNFVSVRVGAASRVYQQLLRSGVIVRPIAGYGMPAHLRVSIGLPEENQRFLDVLPAALAAAEG